MTKNKQRNMGKVLGLALAVSFLAAASAQADVLRATNTSFLDEGYELVEIFTFTYDGTAVSQDHAATWSITYGEGFSAIDGFGYDQTTSTLRTGGLQSVLTSWFGTSPYTHYVGYWSDDTSVLNVNGDAVEGVGSWFNNLVFDYGPLGDELTVNFGPVPIYTFILYVVQPAPVVPEPATIAVLGLGLAGLGLARRRMKK